MDTYKLTKMKSFICNFIVGTSEEEIEAAYDFMIALTTDSDDGAKLACSVGLDNREVFASGLIEIWPHLKRATQLDVINRLREQPKAMLKLGHLGVLEAKLKTEQG